MNTAQELHSAACRLASSCDFASRIDGAGFNKFDADFGHRLAEMPPDLWSDRMERAAYRMLRKYRAQLGRMGIEFDKIPPPAEPAPETAAPSASPDPGGAPRRAASTTAPHLALLRDVTLAVTFPYSPKMIEAAKAIPGRRWDGAKKHWAVTVNRDSLPALREFCSTHGATLTPEAQGLVDGIEAELERRAEMSRVADAPDLVIPGFSGELRPFQRGGVAYMLRAERCFLADEMGLGKTVQALAALQAADAFPAVVICPASLKFNWRNEIKKWLPGRRVAICSAKPSRLSRELVDVVILNYDVLHRWVEELVEFAPKSIVADECHYLKSRTARRTAAAEDLVERLRPRWRYFLTGTPALNRREELIKPLELLDRWEDIGKSRGLYSSSLNETLRSICFVRRLKSEVLSELPAKQRVEVAIELDNRAEYNRAADDVLGFVGRKAAENEEFLASIAHLTEEERQAAIHSKEHSAAERAARAEALVRIEALKQVAAKGKLAAAFEWIDNFLWSGEKLIFFAIHTEIVNAVAARYGAAAVKVTGSTTVEDRQAAVDRFQSDPECKLFVGNIQAAGVGLTLTSASNVAFLELPWRPADLDQAEDRCYGRINDAHGATAWYLLAAETIDDEIYNLLATKLAEVRSVSDGNRADGEGDRVFSALYRRLQEKGTKA